MGRAGWEFGSSGSVQGKVAAVHSVPMCKTPLPTAMSHRCSSAGFYGCRLRSSAVVG